MPPDPRPTVLVLGGTGEGRVLAQLLAQEPALRVVSSLAGRTERPGVLPGTVRVGGFGGVAGLADYLRAEQVAAVVDATHPFAETMSDHAAQACSQTGVPLVIVQRPPWVAGPGDRWTSVATVAEAAVSLSGIGTRALLTIGRQGVGAFAEVRDVWFLVRSIDPPTTLPPDAELLLDRGPFTVDDERGLLQRNDIDVIVTKNSGGGATEAKLVAARELGIPVVVVQRPAPPPGVPTVATAAEAVDWLRRRLLDPRIRCNQRTVTELRP